MTTKQKMNQKPDVMLLRVLRVAEILAETGNKPRSDGKPISAKLTNSVQKAQNSQFGVS
jgi:hypothetical protein